mgnify:FL=1|jgi:ATP-binding cassette subfamily B protein
MFRKKYICVKQHDIKDCGAAVLSTIIKTYGMKLQISKIRDIAGTDMFGTNAYGLVKAAEELGFTAKAIKGTRENLLTEFPKPAIANVITEDNVQHYVVVYKVSKKKVIIADPAKGVRKLSFNEFVGMWTGVLIVLVPSYKFEKKNETKGTFTRFFKMLIPQRYLLANVFFMSLVLTIMGIFASFYFKFLMDEIIPYGLEKTLHLVSLLFLGLYLFQILLGAFRSHLMLYLSMKLDIPLMMGYYKHVVKLPMRFFSTRQIGEIISRFEDAGAIKDAVSGATLTIMMDTILVFVGGTILYIINPTLFLIALIIALLYGVLTWGFYKPFKKLNREAMEQGARVSSYLIESIQGVETIKAFNAEDNVEYETEKRYVKSLLIGKKGGILGNIQGSLKGFVGSVGGLVLLWVGAYFVIKGEITLGQLLTFNAMLAYFLNPLRNLIDLQAGIQQAVVAAERLSEIIDLEIEDEVDEEKKYKPIELPGNIKVEKINFRYGTRRLVLEDINFEINKGEKIAVVGESGSGKTTLAKLLLNFYLAEKGNITFGQMNIKDINKHQLRDKISYVSQNIFLFSDTVENNLLLGNEKRNIEDMITICKELKIHDFVELMPKRYQSKLEEGGANLSGGERQRIAIARALLKKPDILILDEATSNLDAKTEEAITKVLNTKYQEMTMIIIAHRLSTIRNCDKVIVMDRGKIVEIGTHNELIDNKGYYFDLWKSQFPEIDMVRGK